MDAQASTQAPVSTNQPSTQTRGFGLVRFFANGRVAFSHKQADGTYRNVPGTWGKDETTQATVIRASDGQVTLQYVMGVGAVGKRLSVGSIVENNGEKHQIGVFLNELQHVDVETGETRIEKVHGISTAIMKMDAKQVDAPAL